MGDASQRWTNLNYIRRSPFAPIAPELLEREKLKEALKISQFVGTEEKFMTRRCISRLYEMETDAYLQRPRVASMSSP